MIESGLSESWHRLLRDRTLWLQGGAPHVNAVLLVKWVQRVNGRIAGYLEVHRRGGGTSPRLVRIGQSLQSIPRGEIDRLAYRESVLMDIPFSKYFPPPLLEPPPNMSPGIDATFTRVGWCPPGEMGAIPGCGVSIICERKQRGPWPQKAASCRLRPILLAWSKNKCFRYSEGSRQVHYGLERCLRGYMEKTDWDCAEQWLEPQGYDHGHWVSLG